MAGFYRLSAFLLTDLAAVMAAIFLLIKYVVYNIL